MKIILSFDYELYFGSNTGTQEKSMIEPTTKIMSLLDKYDIKATFFVDAGYLLALQLGKEKYSVLEKDYQNLYTQLKEIERSGHDIQLHIHPHWEESYYDGYRWVMNTYRYKLHDFSEVEIEDIVYRYKKVLTDIVGDKVFAHRAGGWCMQPFNKLYKAFKKHNIWLDSTVFKNGQNDSITHYFNFQNSPQKTAWSFEEDPLIEEDRGFFKELPIAAYHLSPLFFWKLIFFKKFGGSKHKNFGDGKAAGGSGMDKLRMLTKSTYSVVSLDGYKSSFLERAFKAFQKNKDNENFVIIGHPKSMSEYSLKKLDNFIIKNNEHKFRRVRDFQNEF